MNAPIFNQRLCGAEWLATQAIKTNMFRGGGDKNPSATPVQRGRPPAYLDVSWWQGELAELDQATQEIARRDEQPALDPCFWATTDECEIAELSEEALFTAPAAELAEMLARPGQSVPCVTSDVGCSVEAAAGLTSDNDTAVAALWERDAAVLDDPCWWSDGCHAFATQ